MILPMYPKQCIAVDDYEQPLVQSLDVWHINVFSYGANIRAASLENLLFANAKTKAKISCAVTAQLISAFVFRYIDNTIPLLSKYKT